jgi:hypothetical protein
MVLPGTPSYAVTPDIITPRSVNERGNHFIATDRITGVAL